MNGANEVKAFLRHHYRHFNSAALIDAAEGYVPVSYTHLAVYKRQTIPNAVAPSNVTPKET